MSGKEPFEQMSPEQFAATLKSLGVAPGKWGKTRTGSFEPTMAKDVKGLMGKVRDALQASVNADQEEIDRLKISLLRLEHGGGR